MNFWDVSGKGLGNLLARSKVGVTLAYHQKAMCRVVLLSDICGGAMIVCRVKCECMHEAHQKDRECPRTPHPNRKTYQNDKNTIYGLKLTNLSLNRIFGLIHGLGTRACVGLHEESRDLAHRPRPWPRYRVFEGDNKTATRGGRRI